MLGTTDPVAVVLTDETRSSNSDPEASCVHWSLAQAEKSPRRTVASDHAGCSVGSYVHGFTDLASAAAAEDTGMLVSAGWVEPEVLSTLPTLAAVAGGINYIPLADLSVDPDLVLLTVTPAQLMALQTAIPTLNLTGKPQCQIIPLAAGGAPCASVGCAVSRARTRMEESRMTCALPLQTFLSALAPLEKAAEADQVVADAVSPRLP